MSIFPNIMRWVLAFVAVSAIGNAILIAFLDPGMYVDIIRTGDPIGQAYSVVSTIVRRSVVFYLPFAIIPALIATGLTEMRGKEASYRIFAGAGVVAATILPLVPIGMFAGDYAEIFTLITILWWAGLIDILDNPVNLTDLWVVVIPGACAGLFMAWLRKTALKPL